MADHSRVIHDGSPRYILRLRDLETDDRPRERLASGGPAALSVAELIAIVWNTGTRKEEVLHMARRVMREYGESAASHETDPMQLAATLGIPQQKACQLIACFELGRRFYAQKAGRPVYVRTTQQAYQHLSPIAALQKEQLRGLYLNSRYEVIHEEVISVGTLTANIIHPREVFQPAIARGAVAVIIAHNHPSGDPSPTADDLAATKQLQAAGSILGIELLDHLIVAETDYISIIEGAYI